MRTKMLVMALGLLIAGGAALAQPAAQRGRMSMIHHPAFLAQLKLTDQQKTQIRSVWFDLQQKQIDVKAKLQHARLDYHELASAATPDQNALSAKIQQMAGLKAQLQQNKLDAWFSVNKLLTAEQQKLWQKVLEHPMLFERRGMMNRGQHYKGMMQGRGMMMGRPGMMRGDGAWQRPMGPGMPQTPAQPDSNN